MIPELTMMKLKRLEARISGELSDKNAQSSQKQRRQEPSQHLSDMMSILVPGTQQESIKENAADTLQKIAMNAETNEILPNAMECCPSNENEGRFGFDPQLMYKNKRTMMDTAFATEINLPIKRSRVKNSAAFQISFEGEDRGSNYLSGDSAGLTNLNMYSAEKNKKITDFFSVSRSSKLVSQVIPGAVPLDVSGKLLLPSKHSPANEMIDVREKTDKRQGSESKIPFAHSIGDNFYESKRTQELLAQKELMLVKIKEKDEAIRSLSERAKTDQLSFQTQLTKMQELLSHKLVETEILKRERLRELLVQQKIRLGSFVTYR